MTVLRGGLMAILVVGLLSFGIVAAASGHPSLHMVRRSSHARSAHERRHRHANRRLRGGKHRRSSAARAAIIGGQTAQTGTFPWLAYILDHRGEVVGQCTGTVVAPRLILTAGHCGENTETGIINEPSGYEVGTGNVDWALAGETVSAVSHVIVYPGFNRSTLVGDAALLELSTPTSAPAITLAADLTGMPAGTEAIMAGWGKTFYEQEYLTEWLRWAETAVQGPTWCEQNATPFDPQSKLCTINPPNYETGTCEGDSGGPLLAQWPEGGAIAEIGITSTVFGECATTRPDEFTRSDLIASWVHEWVQALKRQEEEAAAAAAAKRRQEEEAAAAAKQRQEDEEAAAAAVKKRQEKEAAAAAAAKKHQEEEAAAAAAAEKRQEQEGGVYGGTTSQSQEPIAFVVGSGGRRLTALSTTLVYRCRSGKTFAEPSAWLSNRISEPLTASHSFALTSSGNPRETVSGTVNPQSGTAAGTLIATYRTSRYGRCSTGRVTWSAGRVAARAPTAQIAAPGAYNGWVEPNQHIALRLAPDGRSLVGVHFSAKYKCPRGHSMHPTEWFLSSRDAQALEDFGTFTMYMTGSSHYAGRLDGEVGLIPGSAYGTLEASMNSRWGRCHTGLIWWGASLAR